MLPEPKYANNLVNGISYFGEGSRLLLRRELRLYILVPLIVNTALFVVLTAIFIHHYGGVVDSIMAYLPSILEPLAWIAVIVLGILVVMVYGYSFNMITNILAAPFYGLLAAKTEELLTGNPAKDESIIAMVLRTTLREFAKLWYFLSRGIVIILLTILLGTVPIIGFIAPVIGLAWSAWSMTIQYSDYAADNNQLDFRSLRSCLWRKKFSSLGFGGIIMVCSMIPLVNIFAIPIAVVSGTLFWLRELKGCQEGYCPR